MKDKRATRMVHLLLILLAGVLSYCANVPGAEGLAPSPGGPAPDGVLAPQGATYYVAPSGDDGNPGTINLPWQTIQQAADTLVAGDTVYIRAGVYPEQVVPQNSGSAGSYVTYAAYPGETVMIDGSGITLPDDLVGLFHISGKECIRVSGLRLVNAGPNDDNAGFLVLDSGHIIVENNSTYNTNSSGIGVWDSSHVTVDSNQVEDACGGGWQECISVAGTDAFEVGHNEVLTCHKEGICVKDGSSNGQVYGNHVHDTQRVGIYVDAWDKHTYTIAVYSNVVHDSQDNNGIAIASEQGGLLENVRVYNNIAYNNRYVGLAFLDCCPPATTHPVHDVTVVNNTFFDNGWIVWGGGIGVDNPDIQNVVVRNNIVSQNLYFQIAVATGVPPQELAVEANLIDGYRGTEGEIYGDDYVTGDPLFRDPSGADFHLQPKSPAIDRGSSLDAPTDDLDGRLRPWDGDGDGTAGYDVGAYEAGARMECAIYLPLVVRQW